jgi:hypothetical protein
MFVLSEPSLKRGDLKLLIMSVTSLGRSMALGAIALTLLRWTHTATAAQTVSASTVLPTPVALHDLPIFT